MSTHSQSRTKAPSPAAGRAAALQRKCSCGGSTGPTGECAGCRRKRKTGQAGPFVQTKLRVNRPGDRFEREADRVADRVLNMAPPSGASVQRQPEEEKREDEFLQAERSSGSEMAVAPSMHARISSMRGGGQPLAPSERAFFEPRFGHDFSNVRIHADGQAAEAARAVQARAFTLGRDVVLGSGEYAPGTEKGRRLLAHELAHVLQQEGTREPQMLQRIDWGLLGGKCCNESPEGDEWALVGDGTWTPLAQDDCTGSFTDCDGMTCGGGFYWVSNLAGGVCRTPRQDDDTFAPRRWTPDNPDLPDARSPKIRGSQQGDVPPDYTYDAS